MHGMDLTPFIEHLKHRAPGAPGEQLPGPAPGTGV